MSISRRKRGIPGPVFVREIKFAEFLDNTEDTTYAIISHYKKHLDTEEPLDGDDVECLVEILKAKMNLIEGNLTDTEYSEEIGKLVQ